MRQRSPDGVPNQGIEHLENAVQRMQQADTNSLCTVLSRMPYIHRMRALLLQGRWRHKPIMGRLRTRRQNPLPRCEQQRIRPCKQQWLRPRQLVCTRTPWLSESIALHTSKFRNVCESAQCKRAQHVETQCSFHIN